MVLNKTLAFALSCIAANFILVQGDCVDISPQSNFSFANYAGIWHGRYLSKVLLPCMNHFSAEMQIVNDEVIITGFATELVSGKRLNTSVDGRFEIPEDNSSRVQFQFNSQFSAFNGNYTLISDYNCYLITYGCPGALNIESVSIGFRVENPSQECEETAIAAFGTAGLNFTNLMGPDPMYHQINGPQVDLGNSL